MKFQIPTLLHETAIDKGLPPLNMADQTPVPNDTPPSNSSYAVNQSSR